MSKNTSISVIIPLYNKEKEICRAINSVLTQSHTPNEIIIVNDGSTDTSASQVSNFTDSRIKLIRQENRGVAVARNRGVSEAKSDYVAFLDADDEWKPNFLSLICQLINIFPDAGAYASGYFLKYPDGKTIKADIKTSLPHESGGIIENYFACASNGNGPLFSSAVCVPKKIMLELGGFPEGIHMQEDLYMWVKIALKYPIAFCPQPASIYYKETTNSACKFIVPKREDMLFADTINTAITDSTLKGQHAYHALGYINKYAFQNAFKAIVANELSGAKKILTLVQPMICKEKLKLFLLKFMIVIPNFITYRIWLCGKYLKSKTR